jgi:hypothetical protein
MNDENQSVLDIVLKQTREFARLARQVRPYVMISIEPDEVEEFIGDIEMIREFAEELAGFAECKNPTRSSDPEPQKETNNGEMSRDNLLKLVSPANNNPSTG